MVVLTRGALAHMVERNVRNVKVRGSSPLCSTTQVRSIARLVGACEWPRTPVLISGCVSERLLQRQFSSPLCSTIQKVEDMKNYSSILLALPLLLAGCGVTRIVTVAPEPVVVAPAPATSVVVAQAQPVTYQTPVSTTVTYPRTHTTRTTTIEVTPMTQDISLYLDLQAVAAAFAQAATVEEFETILNSNAYIISNLDLNHDGYIDYLRVLETLEGRNHVLLLQAVLAANVYQDVATLVVEMGYATPYVQIIGAPYIYGVNYIIEPVFYRRPPLFDRFGRPTYAYWRSPYYWDHFPHHYGHHAPYHLGHYQAYVSTYLQNHHYCHQVHYVDHYHYSHYQDVCRPVSRNDYEQQYPEQSFSRRTTATYVPQGSTTATRVTNAHQLQKAVEQSGASRTTTSTRSTSTQSATSTRQTQPQAGSGSRTTESTRTTSTSGTSTQRVQPTATQKQTATTSRTTATTQKAEPAASSTRTSSATQTTKSTATQSSRTSTATSTTTQKSQPATSTRASSTTTTRVRNSGTTSTKRTQASSAARTNNTSTRSTGTSTGTSTRSSSSSSSSRSGSTGTSTRTSGSSSTSTRR